MAKTRAVNKSVNNEENKQVRARQVSRDNDTSRKSAVYITELYIILSVSNYWNRRLPGAAGRGREGGRANDINAGLEHN